MRIFCPRGTYAEKPVPGLWNWGCPKLLWELMNTRRVKLSAQQLLSRNVSEAIMDKDNHARDAMKYHLMSHPEPGQKSLDRRVTERVNKLAETDPTMAVAQFNKIVREEEAAGGGRPSAATSPFYRRRVAEAARMSFEAQRLASTTRRSRP